jgi:predicted alpha/beta hydrolase family esterase
MKVKDADILFIPGEPALDESHWLARWQGRLSTGRRLEVDHADAENPAVWIGKVARAVNEAERPVVLVAHGPGVTAAVHAAADFTAPVAGSFFVAPADPVSGQNRFDPFPAGPLPFPSLLVASRDDPHCDFSRAEEFASDWGSLFIDAGNVGRLDVHSGHGPWPEGSMTFARFVSRLPGR